MREAKFFTMRRSKIVTAVGEIFARSYDEIGGIYYLMFYVMPFLGAVFRSTYFHSAVPHRR